MDQMQGPVVRLRDLDIPVVRALGDLPRDRYLGVMWIICSEMRDIYVSQDLMTAYEQWLMRRTLGALRSTIAKGRVVRRSLGLRLTNLAWNRAARSERGMTGTLNVRFTFCSLSHELSGTWAGRRASSRVTMPFVDIPWVTHIPTGLGFRRVDNRTVEENGITADLLRAMLFTCTAVRDLSGPVTVADLDRIRRTAFGSGWVRVEPNEADLERYRVGCQARQERRANASRPSDRP